MKVLCPDGEDAVTKRIESEEGRINSEDKMISLYSLRDFVFRDRMDSFHWDLDETVETEKFREEDESFSDNDIDDQVREKTVDEIEEDGVDDDDVEEDLNATQSARRSVNDPQYTASPGKPSNSERNQAPESEVEPYTRVSYVPGQFVVVQVDMTANNTRIPFWIGKVLKVSKTSGKNYATSVSVHWFDNSNKRRTPQNYFQHPYYPCYKGTKKNESSRPVPRSDLRTTWTDEIHTDAVVLTFPSLKKNNCLPANVQNKLSSKQ